MYPRLRPLDCNHFYNAGIRHEESIGDKGPNRLDALGLTDTEYEYIRGNYVFNETGYHITTESGSTICLVLIVQDGEDIVYYLIKRLERAIYDLGNMENYMRAKVSMRVVQLHNGYNREKGVNKSEWFIKTQTLMEIEDFQIWEKFNSTRICRIITEIGLKWQMNIKYYLSPYVKQFSLLRESLMSAEIELDI